MRNLFVSHYTDSNSERQLEYVSCLTKNIANKSIDKIYLVCESEPFITVNPKVKVIVIKSRPTYNVFFDLIRQLTKPEDWNIIANSDIYFDNTIEQVSNKPANCLVALTRYEVNKSGAITFLNRADSQDVWAFKGYANVSCDFTLGVAGCDNVLAFKFAEARYMVINPSRSIKVYHLHSSGIRNYTSLTRLKPPYKLIPPTV